MKYLIITLLLITNFAFAAKAGFQFEPLYGIERTQRLYPEPAKIVTRTFLGARATYGVPLLSGELQVTQSLDDESFQDQNLKVAYTSQKAMLGFRSYPIRGKYLGVFFRAGVRAQKTKRDITENGESRTEETDIEYDPYAGTGLTIAFASNFALNTGATLAYNKEAIDGEHFDSQYTFGFTIRAGK